MKPSQSIIFKSDSLAKPQGEGCEDRSKQACGQQLAMEPSRSTISKADSLSLAKPQGEGCEDQSTSEDISASAGVPASKKMKKCPTSKMKPCASAVNDTFHPSGTERVVVEAL